VPNEVLEGLVSMGFEPPSSCSFFLSSSSFLFLSSSSCWSLDASNSFLTLSFYIFAYFSNVSFSSHSLSICSFLSLEPLPLLKIILYSDIVLIYNASSFHTSFWYGHLYLKALQCSLTTSKGSCHLNIYSPKWKVARVSASTIASLMFLKQWAPS